MKIILDTNVFVSGVFFSGPPYQILEAWRDDKIQLVISPEIMGEYRRVGEILAEEHPGFDLESFIELVVQKATTISLLPLHDPVCEDPDDDKFWD